MHKKCTKSAVKSVQLSWCTLFLFYSCTILCPYSFSPHLLLCTYILLYSCLPHNFREPILYSFCTLLHFYYCTHVLLYFCTVELWTLCTLALWIFNREPLHNVHYSIAVYSPPLILISFSLNRPTGPIQS